ncbi:cytochrome P450 2J5-like [Pantherophis guttatus]|uniref:Cytochrome P450 2J5-like n=1 Tax=Pantherophis guttatus TaxID=94885 RepID=A0ABM3YXQ8_PANGU|nr:cytochrome P450 2J5-like [Pantherophis guttatus]
MLKPLFLLILWIPRQILSYLKQIWSRKRYPPGPFPLPVIGSMWRRFDTSITEMTFRKMAKDYGNIYSFWGGGYHCIVLCGYRAVKEVLIDHSEAFVDRLVTPYILTATKEKGIIFSNGHTWQQQRRFGIVTMRKLGLGKKGMEAQIQEEAQQLVEFFAETKGQPFDPSLSIMKSFSNVICAAVFGHRFSTEDKNFLELVEAIFFLAMFGSSVPYLLYEAFPSIMKHLPGPHQTALSFVEMMLSFAKKEIKKHKENHSQHEPQDFIDFYLFQMEKRKDDPNSTYNEDNLAQCIVDFFVAGTETTASSLKWALLFMASHLDIQDKVYEEMEKVFSPSHSICYEDRKKLPYTNAVIHELMRTKYSLLFGLPRQSVQDIYSNGFLFPKGAIIIADLRSVLFDPEQWETPEEFNPNHFLDKEGNFVKKEVFLPFGAGARVCLGQLLANIELFNTFTRLLRAFRLEPPEGVELSEKSIIGATVHPAPYKICALPRIRTP